MIQVYDKYGKIKSSGLPGSGTVTSLSAGDLSPLFNSTVTSPTSTPNVSFSKISQSQNLFYASPNGSSGLPTFRALVAADLPAITGYVPTSRTLTINGVTYDLTADRSWTVTASGATWGSITGTLTAQTDLTLYLSTNYFPIPVGTISQYIDGTGALQTFPTIPTVGTWGALNYPNWTTGTPFVKMTAAGTFALDTNTYLTTAVTSIATAGLISGGTITSTGTITTSMSTNKLVGRYSTGTGVMEEITIGSGLTLTGLGVLNNTAAPSPVGYYGAWQDNFTQTAAVSNVGYPLIYRTVDLENQVRVVTNGTNLTRITFDNTGIYNLQFSVQIQNTDNAQHDVTIWIRKNGVDVAGSSGYISIPARKSAGAGNEGHGVYGWNYLLSIVAGEYYEIVWSTSNAANVTIQYYPGATPPPSTASVIVTVTQQSGIMAGTGITAINSLTGAAQTLTTGTTGTDFAIVDSGVDHKFNLPTASASNRGALSSTDWTSFNNRKKKVISDATSVTVTGTTVLTLVKTFEITTGTLPTNGVLDLFMYSTRTGTSAIHTMGLYINTTNNFATATLIATATTGGNFTPILPFKATYVLKNNLLIGGIFSGNSGTNYIASATQTSVACNNTSASVWFFVGVTLVSLTSSVDFQAIEMTT
jgi:hypothetical protein